MKAYSLLIKSLGSSRRFCIYILIICLIGACAPSTPRVIPTLVSIQITPALDSSRQSSGGGEPRTAGYWLIWNTCVEGNQAETARANGGREAGWIVMDDLLSDPGMLVGELQVESCQQGVSLLQARNLQGTEMKLDAAYTLAAQLLVAQLNLATGSEYCPASDQAVSKAQLLMLKLHFDATGSYLGPPLLNEDMETAKHLEEQLTQYNAGILCVP
jgi:hypothetical protein